MLMDVVIAVTAAFAAGGMVFGLFRIFKRTPPKWVIPTVAAIAIVGVTAHLRYDWENRAELLLPKDIVVVERLPESTLLEPWSLIQPVVSSLVAVDTVTAKRNEAHPEMVLIDLVMLRRADDTLIIPHIVDCAAKRVAPMPADPTFDADGLPLDVNWREGAPDKLFAAACKPL